jgi:hypothetical protein
MISRFFTTDPAPLDVRVARVVAPPWPFAAYFLIRAPQVADGVMVPWPEAVAVTLLAAVLVPIWLYWVADLVGWRRDRPTPAGEPSPLELTADLSDHGTFEGDLRALVDAEAHGRTVPPRFRDVLLHGVSAFYPPTADDRPTEPLLLTHEFTPASGVAMDYPEQIADDSNALMSWIRQEIAEGRSPTGRHRKPDAHPIPPIADVPNPEAYAFLNRSRELGY